MTKKHFIALADSIKNQQRDGVQHCFNEHSINCLADFCQSQNPRFNRERWIGYIKGTNGKNGGKVK